MDSVLVTTAIACAGLVLWNVAGTLKANRSSRRTRARVQAMVDRRNNARVSAAGVDCLLVQVRRLSTHADYGRFVYSATMEGRPFVGWVRWVRHTRRGSTVVLQCGRKHRFPPQEHLATEARSPL